MVFCCELKKVVDDTYDIEIGHSLEEKLVDDLKHGLTGKKRFAVITDSIVEGLYGRDIYEKIVAAGFSAE
ncbi:MAG: 3-dehydroquinate synthase, partial [Ruminococcus sp.]|nr:3-dehydroquinate synthase [Ruminococcus sp.]